MFSATYLLQWFKIPVSWTHIWKTNKFVIHVSFDNSDALRCFEQFIYTLLNLIYVMELSAVARIHAMWFRRNKYYRLKFELKL